MLDLLLILLVGLLAEGKLDISLWTIFWLLIARGVISLLSRIIDVLEKNE